MRRSAVEKIVSSFNDLKLKIWRFKFDLHLILFWFVPFYVLIIYPSSLIRFLHYGSFRISFKIKSFAGQRNQRCTTSITTPLEPNRYKYIKYTRLRPSRYHLHQSNTVLSNWHSSSVYFWSFWLLSATFAPSKRNLIITHCATEFETLDMASNHY